MLWYDVIGEGEPLLLVHGAGDSSKVFRESGVVDELAADFKVILLDLTGMGQSERVSAVSPTQWCEDVLSVLDAVGEESAHLGGVSLGSRIVARVALEHPARVRTLFLDWPVTAIDQRGERELVSAFTDLDNHPWRPRWERGHGSDWREVLDFYARARTDRNLQQYLTLRPHLAEIQAPVLICRGDLDDGVHPLDQALEWHRAANRSWLWITPGSQMQGTHELAPRELAEVYHRFVVEMKSSEAVSSH
ncbi:alpha/beta fold hydrolase [Streptomyces sp. NPDC055078]